VEVPVSRETGFFGGLGFILIVLGVNLVTCGLRDLLVPKVYVLPGGRADAVDG
jgi:hypothetical protein